MGRLTEAFGFCHIHPDDFSKMWLKHNITMFDPKPKMYELRKQIIRDNTKELKEDENAVSVLFKRVKSK